MANPQFPRFNTQVALLGGIPWDRSYKHLRKFTSVEERNAYLVSKQLFSVGDVSYIRPFDPDPIRVEFNQEQLAQCNYLFFHNDVSWWYCCFITGISYLADGTSEISFEIDWWTTYQFQLQIKPCMVEREHVSNDAIGRNTVPENLETGPMTIEKESFDDLGGLVTVLAATMDYLTKKSFTGNTVNNVYTGLGYYNSEVAPMESYIQAYIEAGIQDAIVVLYMAPKRAITEEYPDAPSSYFQITPNMSTINGYVPKNKKLFCYPYHYLTVQNNAGSSNNYRFELWSKTTPGIDPKPAGYYFYDDCSYVTMAEALAVPLGYKGLDKNYGESLLLNNFPQCAFAGDTFRTWWAQNKSVFTYNQAKGGLMAIGQGLLSAATANPFGVLGAVEGFANATLGAELEKERMEAMPDSFRGTAQAASIMARNSRVGFSFQEMSIKAEYARKIDDYFTMFGYKIMRLKAPDLTSRASWNYVKTIGAEVTGNVPEWVLEKFIQRLDTGCWFWHTNDVGNFGLSNQIVEVG